MIANINGLFEQVGQSPLGKTARRSANIIWNAHLAALETTRDETGRVFQVAIKESGKLRERTRDRADDVVGEIAGRADEQLGAFEEAVQRSVKRVIHRIGLPTAQDVDALSRRVETLAKRIETQASRKRKTAKRRRPAAKKRAKTAAKRAA